MAAHGNLARARRPPGALPGNPREAGRGEVHEINDLITLNLDIWQFARDAIVNSEGPELLRAFWQAISCRKSRTKSLNPALLSSTRHAVRARFSSPLSVSWKRFTAIASTHGTLPRGSRFISPHASKGDIAGKGNSTKIEKFTDFKNVLEQIDKHPNERYFILKSIIINNLFGVDIMEEAVEICKLRLFLKLVAQVETAEPD